MLGRLDNPYYMYNRFFPFPGNELYRYCSEKGLIDAPKQLSEWSGFILWYNHKGNLSEIPQEMLDETAASWMKTYSMQRVRFTIKHDPKYFLTIFTDPLKFFRELKDLIRYQVHTTKFHRIALKMYPDLANSSKNTSTPTTAGSAKS
jgi:hypothetical protein